jgi:uncharacterized protein DUF262
MPHLAPRKKEQNRQPLSIPTLADQLDAQRRSVDFDTFDISVEQLISMVKKKTIEIAPVYQRQFRWDSIRCSQLVESLFLGIPVPSLFMAANADSSWELVDGVQRLSTLIKFAGETADRERFNLKEPLVLTGLEKLTSFDGKGFVDLPESLRLHFLLRPIKVITLSDKSDKAVRFDLFERLNTGGVKLSDQEVRDCVYRGDFSKLLEQLSKDQNFRKTVRLTERQETDGTREECVLRFFAFFDRYLDFEHSVREFLNQYADDANRSFDKKRAEKLFKDTFLQLASVLPDTIRRPSRRGTTPLNLFEGVAVGAALAVSKTNKLEKRGIAAWMASPELLAFTTQATNDRRNVKGRIEYCRDKFLGK